LLLGGLRSLASFSLLVSVRLLFQKVLHLKYFYRRKYKYLLSGVQLNVGNRNKSRVSLFQWHCTSNMVSINQRYQNDSCISGKIRGIVIPPNAHKYYADRNRYLYVAINLGLSYCRGQIIRSHLLISVV